VAEEARGGREGRNQAAARGGGRRCCVAVNVRIPGTSPRHFSGLHS
jgi:hypothetical protein